MMNGIISFSIGLLSIALMVTIHETGHFLLAKLTGISVEVYAIGWGKAIKKWQSKGTEYRINIFPLGGYCRLKGSEDLKRSLDSGKSELSGNTEGSLFSVPPLKRIPTYIAGSLFNLLFALVLFIPFFMIDHESYVDPNRIVVSSDYPTVFGQSDGLPNAAGEAGMRTGDTIVAIEGHHVDSFREIQEILATRTSDGPTLFTVERNGRRLDIAVVPRDDEATGRPLFGISSFIVPRIGAIDGLSPESTTPMRTEDVVVAVQGIPVAHTIALMEVLISHPREVSMQVRHLDGSIETFSYIPQKDMEGNNLYGFSISRPIETVAGLSIGDAIIGAFGKLFTSIADTVRLIPSLFTRDGGLGESVAGPLRISYVIGEMRNAGIRTMLHLLAMVSISLAIANLLPIPGLDGGAILLSLIEGLSGRRVSPKWYVRFQTAGMAFLLFIMLFVLSADIRYFLSGPH
jgi:regulator of sigma E protease